MVSRDLDGSYPWLDPDRPVTTLHLLRAAESTEPRRWPRSRPG